MQDWRDERWMTVIVFLDNGAVMRVANVNYGERWRQMFLALSDEVRMVEYVE